jgi:hypothetical protein
MTSQGARQLPDFHGHGGGSDRHGAIEQSGGQVTCLIHFAGRGIRQRPAYAVPNLGANGSPGNPD